MDINESPVYVLLNPSINHAQKDLPVTIYESGNISCFFSSSLHGFCLQCVINKFLWLYDHLSSSFLCQFSGISSMISLVLNISAHSLVFMYSGIVILF